MPYYPPANGPFPLGIYCDPRTGDIQFTPAWGAGGQFIGVMAVQIKQWKKFAGVYNLMGTTMRDNIVYLISCPPNNLPRIMTNPSIGNQPKLDWKVSSGSSICFNVIGKDTDFNTTTTPIISDTTYLTWNSALASKGATFLPTYNIANRKITGPREDSYQFCWTPDSTMVSSIPWFFTVKVIDNRCPYVGRTARTFGITVVGAPSGTIIKNTASCYKWNLSYSSPHPEYITSQQWQVSNTKNIFDNTNFSSFTSSTIGNFLFNDTGKYVVKLILYGDVNTGYINTTFDTIYNTSRFRLANLFDSTICLGQVPFIKLKANHSGGTPPLTTTWYDYIQNTILSLNDSLIISPTTSKDYAFVVIDSTGCSLSVFSNITVNPLPIHFPIVNARICSGSNYIFDAGNNNVNIKNYFWNTGDTTRTITRNDSNLFWSKITNSFGCNTIDSFHLYVNPIPATNAGNDTTICKGKSIQLHAIGANTYQWFALPSAAVIGNINSLSVLPDTMTSYRVIGTDTTSNMSCSNSDTVKVFVNPKPVIPSISGPTPVYVNQANSYLVVNHIGSIFNWFLSSGNISSGQGTNVVNARFTSAGSGQINVAESQNNCWSDTASKGITVNLTNGINEQTIFENLNVYPNPTSGLLNIAFETSEKTIQLEVIDILGRSMITGHLQHAGGLFQHSINISELHQGIYFLKIYAEGKVATIKVTLK